MCALKVYVLFRPEEPSGPVTRRRPSQTGQERTTEADPDDPTSPRADEPKREEPEPQEAASETMVGRFSHSLLKAADRPAQLIAGYWVLRSR